MEKAEKLQSKIQSNLEGITPEDYSSWLAHPCSKVLFATLDLDEENLRTGWQLGEYGKRQEAQAQGQAFYILGLRDDLRHMLAEIQGVPADA